MENDFKNTIYKNKLIGYVGFMGESVKKRKAKQATVQNDAACNYQLFNLYSLYTTVELKGLFSS